MGGINRTSRYPAGYLSRHLLQINKVKRRQRESGNSPLCRQSSLQKDLCEMDSEVFFFIRTAFFHLLSVVKPGIVIHRIVRTARKFARVQKMLVDRKWRVYLYILSANLRPWVHPTNGNSRLAQRRRNSRKLIYSGVAFTIYVLHRVRLQIESLYYYFFTRSYGLWLVELTR